MYNKTKNDIIKTILEKLDSEDTNFIKFFMSPAWYTIIKTYCDKNKINLNNLKFDDNVEEFLNKLWFYDWKYEISKDTVLPIKTITTQYCDDEIEETTNKFGELLKEYMWKWKDNIIRNIIKILWELLNNISHHSWEKDLLNDDWKVFISQNYQSGQYYSKKTFYK